MILKNMIKEECFICGGEPRHFESTSPMENKTKKETWACADCGATTTDPAHRLIVFFHMNCPARGK